MCSGNCADFPTAPASSPSVKPVSTAPPSAPECASSLMAWMSKSPALVPISSTASRKPRSPKRVTMKAFFAAAAAEGRSNQKPIRR